MKMCGADYKITGHEIGESLTNYNIQKNWLILADRIYASLTGIAYCLSRSADFVLRVRHNAFNMYDENNKKINLLSQLTDVTDKRVK